MSYEHWSGSVPELWEDLRFPASALQAPASNYPDRDGDDGTFLFGTGEQAFVIAQMPHAWKEGSIIRPHIHWSPVDTGSGNVAWQISYQVAGIGEAFSGSWTDISALDAADGVAEKHQVAPDVSGLGVGMTDKKISTMLKFKVSRIASGDTYGSDARFLEFDIHYQLDTKGSIGLFNKWA